MKIKNHSKISFVVIVILLLISSVFAGAINVNESVDKNDLLEIEKTNQFITTPAAKKIADKISDDLFDINYATNLLNGGGSQLDQYQTYGDCWIGTNISVIKLAQRFKPVLEFLDYIQLKIWINFLSPIINIKFYIYNNNGNLPGSLITSGTSLTYSSTDFLYSLSTPDPNNDNQCPWYTIEFPNDPHLTIGNMYWIVLEITEYLPGDKHVYWGGYYGDLYPDGYLAWYADGYGWYYDLNDWNIDLMFKTFGYNPESNLPTADADGSYYGFIGGGETIQFDGTGSHDNDEGGNSIIQYDWKFYSSDSWHNNIGPTPTKMYSNDGTYTVTLRVHDDEGDTGIDETTVTIYPPGPPYVNYVETYYADGSSASNGQGLLLQGMDLTNTYKASVSGADIDRVEFVFGTQTYTDTNSGDGWTASFNTKDIILPSATLKVRAHNQHDWSSSYEIYPRIIPRAGWLVQFIQYVCDYNDTDFASFSISTKDYPPKLKNNYWTLNAAVDFSTGSPENPDESPVQAGVDVPVDDVGGDYSYSGGIGSSVCICSDGIIEVSGGFEASVAVKNISGSINASLYGSITIGDEIIWNYMYLTINGEVTIPVFYIPLEVCGIGVEAGIDITPHVEITFHLEPTTSGGIVPGLGIKIKDNEGIEGNVGAMVKAYAEVGFVIGEFYTEAGGDATLYFQTPSPPGYFKDFVLFCWIGGRLRLLYWTVEAWWTYEWSYSDQRWSSKEYDETSWGAIERDYLNPDNGVYNDFIWDDSSNTGPVINNVFPYANPCIAYFPGSAGTKVMMVWSHDDKDQPRVNGMEIQYTIWDRDEGMDNPQPILETHYDDKLQMDPKIAFDVNGNAVCVFVQTDSSISDSSSFEEVCEATEICYCVWDKNSETWGSIHTLTSNNQMDVSPVISSNIDGDVVLIWTSDGDNDHTTVNDRSIYASFWDGSAWSDIQTVTENQPLVSTPQLAVSDDRGSAICVFTMDGDSDPSSPDDQNIFYTTFSQDRSEISIVQFTSDYTYQDTAASVVFGQDNNAYIVWLKKEHADVGSEEIYDGTLYYKQVGSSRVEAHEITSGTISDPVAIPSQGSSRFDNFNFAVGWGSSKPSHTLNCAKIKANNEIESGIIYGSNLKISETHWCIAPGSITATTVERPVLKNHSKNCNLSFIAAAGFDDTIPVTIGTLEGEYLGCGEDGPIYKGDVTVYLEANDEGGSGLDNTYCRIDFGSWQIYNGGPLIFSEKGKHKVGYYSIDKAGNKENLKHERFVIGTKPKKPLRPSGPTQGIPGVEYTYTTSTTDADGDQLYYYWHWETGMSGWMGPYDSGETVYVNLAWPSRGTYTITVWAKDAHGAESEKATLEVTMPKNKQLSNPLFYSFLMRLMQRFPVLELLLSPIFIKYGDKIRTIDI